VSDSKTASRSSKCRQTTPPDRLVTQNPAYLQAKLKAYSVSEFETFDNAAQGAYLPSARQAIEAHHGKALRTAAGRVVQIEGAAPPKNVGIVEWDSVDDALAFYKSDAWKAMQPQRDKAYKLIRRYVVETEK